MYSYNDFRMYKKAGAVSDTIGAAIYSNVPFVNTIGTLHGAFADKSTNAEIVNNMSPEASFLPGVGESRLMRRLRRQNTINGTGTAPRALSSHLGEITSTMLLAISGGIAGYLSGNKKDAMEKRFISAATGAIGGAALATLGNSLGSASAFLTDTRTKKEQQEAAASTLGQVADWLVPGVGRYNYWKSIGRAIADEEQGITSTDRVSFR